MSKGIAVIMLAMLAMGSFSFIPSLASAGTEFEGTWVRMRGIITQWGSDPVFGWIGAHAGMVNANGTYREWARVHAIWSYDRPRLNCTKPPTENFTISFYTTRLVNTTGVALDYSGYDFYVSGLWNVANITITVLVDENGTLISFTRTFEPIVTNATGELHVFDAWNKFELNITGIDLLKGFAMRAFITHVEIKICDMNDDGKVDLIDLVRVAKRYRTVPGCFHYNLDMDLNCDGVINIGDLTTCAANIEG